MSSVSPLFSGSRRQLGSPSRGPGVIRGTWGSGSRYSRTGPNAFQHFYSSHCVLLHTCRRSAPLPQMRNYCPKELSSGDNGTTVIKTPEKINPRKTIFVSGESTEQELPSWHESGSFWALVDDTHLRGTSASTLNAVERSVDKIKNLNFKKAVLLYQFYSRIFPIGLACHQLKYSNLVRHFSH